MYVFRGGLKGLAYAFISSGKKNRGDKSGLSGN